MRVLVATDCAVENLTTVRLSGKFIAKVYEGEFKNIKAKEKDFTHLFEAKALELKNLHLVHSLPQMR